MFRCLRVAGVALVALVCAKVCRAEEDSESPPWQFEAEYPKAVHALMHHQGHLVIEARHEWTRAHGYPQIPPLRMFEFASRGHSVRVIRYPATGSMRSKDPQAWVGVDHPRLSFSLSRSKDASGFSVDGIDLYEGRLASIRLDAWPLFGAHVVYEAAVQDFAREHGFQWTRFEALGGEEDLVRAEFLLPEPDNPAADMAGWFLFTRSGRWALHGWCLDHAGNPGQAYREAEITYQPRRSAQGIPLRARVVYHVYRASHGKQPVQEEMWTITRIEPAGVLESAVRLPAFGLPNVATEIDPRRRMRWIILAGLIAVAAAALAACWHSRRACWLALAG